MTFISLGEATHRLNIDVKTLHRWLAEASLPLLRHPHDGRKKVVSLEHLQELARLHHRQLTSSSKPSPGPASQPDPNHACRPALTSRAAVRLAVSDRGFTAANL